MKSFDLGKVDVHKFLEELEIRNITDATTEEIRFSCPFPGHLSGDENPSAYMNAETTAWYCHGCKRKGNAISFLSDLHNFSYLTSVKFLRERFGGGFQAPKDTLEAEINEFFLEQGKPETPLINYPLQDRVLSDFSLEDESALCYLHARGFTDEILEKFQIGYDKISGRIAIPIFDELGRLVGFKGRGLLPENIPKYKVLGGSAYGFPRYHVGLVVYGLDLVPRESKSAILVEGELNVLAMHQLGFTNTIAIGGSTFTETHAKKIIDRFNRITLFFDSDKAGNEATHTAIKLLEPYIPVRVVPQHDLDPGDALQRFQYEIKQKEYIVLNLAEASGTITLMIEESSEQTTVNKG